jgi:periplasmic protein TonB
MKNTEKNLDDIIFENRNKDYGAYSLRKSYNKNMMSAMVIAIVIFLLGVSIPLIANYYDRDRMIGLDDDITVTINPPPTTTTIDPPPLTPVEKKKIIAFRAPIVMNTDEEVPELSDLIEISKNTNPSDTMTEIGIPEDKPKTTVIDEDEELKIHMVVEESPEFPGGDNARIKFLRDNIIYPKVAKDAGISGPVHLTFVVEKDGTISNVGVLRGIGGGCDEEATRVVSSMPKWKPGRQNGKEVRVQFNMPINFKLM